MSRRLYTLFLCLAMLFPNIAKAQFFAKQKVVIWEISDRNNDVKVAESTKQEIRQSMVDAFVGSQNYEAFEINVNTIRSRLHTMGLTMSPSNIVKVINESTPIDYVVFTSMKVVSRSNSYNDYTILLSSDMMSSETLKNERTNYVEMKSDINEIPVACAKLIGGLLGEHLGSSNTSLGINANSYSHSTAYTYSTPNGNFIESELGLNMQMVYVEGGTFLMGATPEQGDDAFDDEKPVHSVTLDDYYISATEVTLAQWMAVMGTSIEDQYNKYLDDPEDAVSPGELQGRQNQAMEFVSWYEAKEFCSRLSKITGKSYALPTEAQWEYAARGGKKSKGYKYSGGNYPDAVMWSENAYETQDVALLKANELGLYDMSGNVGEWCYDIYRDDYYSSSPTVNPIGPSIGKISLNGYEERRVLRGGVITYPAFNGRVSNRSSLPPSEGRCGIGFRVVYIP